jgi:hypothetical protein
MKEMKLKTQTFALAVVFQLIGIAVLRADDSMTSTSAAPAVNPAPKKHHHKYKKAADVPATNSAMSASSNVPAPKVGADPGSSEIPNLYQNRDAGALGEPNRGTGDHIPGTSGTSGQ